MASVLLTNDGIAYYTLSSLSIGLGALPEKYARKLPKHPVPAALIGRLAVSQSVQGMASEKCCWLMPSSEP